MGDWHEFLETNLDVHFSEDRQRLYGNKKSYDSSRLSRTSLSPDNPSITSVDSQDAIKKRDQKGNTKVLMQTVRKQDKEVAALTKENRRLQFLLKQFKKNLGVSSLETQITELNMTLHN